MLHSQCYWSARPIWRCHHGTLIGYDLFGCRCPSCREAHVQRKLARRRVQRFREYAERRRMRRIRHAIRQEEG